MYSKMIRASSMAKNALGIAHRQGLRALVRETRQHFIRPHVDDAVWRNSYAFRAFEFAADYDFSADELERSLLLTRAASGASKVSSINWYLPGFAHAFFGGMQTILRFAAHFAERHQVENCFIVTAADGSADASEYSRRIAAAFPALRHCRVIVTRPHDVAAAPDADASIATFWTTAYRSLKANNVRRKFYFIQDCEPLFYPAGSTSAQSEATYRFGFYGLCNTVGLRNDYEADYGGSATSFNPCVDTGLFHPSSHRDWEKRPFKVFFYGRPMAYRNAFELGVDALRKVKERLGDKVSIFCAGQQWDPATYGLGGVIENLGFLSYQQTAELYRTSDVGLAMMFTRHPSYLPFELMASGCLVVANRNNATSWFLKDEVNCLLTMPSASCISQRIIDGLENVRQRQAITAAAHSLIMSEFSDWGGQAESVFEYMQNPGR